MKKIKLFDYQEEMKCRVADAFRCHRAVMVQMPTGTGKTVLLASIVRQFMDEHPSRSVWIVAHRRELVSQIEETTLRFFTISTSKPSDSSRFTHPSSLKILSVQWLSRHADEVEGKPGLIVIDEAHHALAKTYKEMWERYPEARFLGLTATPCRLSGKGFTDLFEVLVRSWDVPQFIQQGRLSTYDFVSLKADSVTQRLIDSLKKRGADGDYQAKEMDLVLNKKPSIERLYRSFCEYAKGRKGIVYAINIEHAKAIAEFYQSHGVATVAIDAKTPASLRKELIERFKFPSSSSIQVLVNVDIFSEGFDCPDVEFVQLARPTLSLAKYLQMVGRGLRVAKGKKSCMIIDNVGLYRVFGLPSQVWDWEAMFEGTLSRKQLQASVKLAWRQDMAVHGENGELIRIADPELEVVVTHSELGKMVANGQQEDELSLQRQRLLRGDFGKVKQMQHDLVKLCDKKGFVNYVDLRNMKKFPATDGVRPRVVSYGNIQLIMIGGMFYTRTRKVFSGVNFACDNKHLDFYLRIPVAGTNGKCISLEMVDSYPLGSPYRYSRDICVVNGDDSQCYWLAGEFSSSCILIMDFQQQYYLLEKGKEKVPVARGEQEMMATLPQLREQKQKKKEQQMQQWLEYIDSLQSVEPYQKGLKWGLMGCDGQVITRALYSAVRPEEHRLIAFAVSPYHWGVMARNGEVLLEPQYEKVVIKGECEVLVKMSYGCDMVKKVDNPFAKGCSVK